MLVVRLGSLTPASSLAHVDLRYHVEPPRMIALRESLFGGKGEPALVDAAPGSSAPLVSRRTCLPVNALDA